MEEKLFELLRAELWGMSLSFSQLSHEEFEDLIAMAGEQTVTGLVGDCLIKNGVKLEREDALGLYAKMKAIEKANARVNENLVSFVNFMERKGIDYIIVKGQVAGSLYPNPDARMSGDVDLYFVGDNYTKIKSLVEQRLGKQLSKLSDGKHVEFEVNGVVFELHDKLSQLATRKHQAYWDQMIDNAILEKTDTVTVSGKEIHTLNATYNALYIFVHLFFHMTASGLGLRQICDWAVALDKLSDNIDKNRLQEILKELGYYKANKANGAFIVDYLGLPEDKYPFSLTENDRKWINTIKKNILKNGNFGRSRRKIQKTGFFHSIESGWLILTQMLTFYRLAPKEVFFRFASIGEWFMERFKIKGVR